MASILGGAGDGPDKSPTNLRTLSLVAPETGGNMRRLRIQEPSGKRACSPEWTIPARLCFALKADQGQDWRCPVSRLTSFTPQLFWVILLRRLHLPLPLTVRNCWCNLPVDSRGHHRAVCARSGVLGGRGWAVENAAARICREAGGRVTPT